MSNSNKLGTQYIEVQARVEKAERKLAEFKQKVSETATSADASADKIGQGFDNAGTRVKDGMKKAERGVDSFADELERLQREVREARAELAKLDAKAKQTGQEVSGIGASFTRVTGGAEKLQGVLGKLLIPAAIVASVKGLIDSLKAANDEATQLRRTFDDMADDAERTAARAVAANDVSDAVLSQQDILKEAQRQADAINRQMYDSIAETSSLFSKFKGSIAGLVYGEDNSADAKIRAANEATERIFSASLKRIQASKTASDRAIAAEAQEAIDALEQRRLSAIEREIEAERAAIDRLRELREQADSDATRNKIEEAILATQIESSYRREAIHQEAELAKRLADERSRAEIEAIEARALAAERSLLTTAEQVKARQADELAEVREQIAEVRRDGIDTATGEDRTLAALQRIEAVLITQAEWAAQADAKRLEAERERDRAAPDMMREAVGESVQRVFDNMGVLQIQQTLGAIYRNSEAIADEVRSRAY